MEFKRNSVIALHLAGKSQPEIVRQLKHLKVNRMFVHRTINRYNDTGSIAKRHGGGPKRTATSPEMIQEVMKRIEQNPHSSGRQMAHELNISPERMHHILRNELGLKASRCQKAHNPTDTESGETKLSVFIEIKCRRL